VRGAPGLFARAIRAESVYVTTEGEVVAGVGVSGGTTEEDITIAEAALR
jgi:uncharacterized protein GlcG (DUF336 family)